MVFLSPYMAASRNGEEKPTFPGRGLGDSWGQSRETKRCRPPGMQPTSIPRGTGRTQERVWSAQNLPKDPVMAAARDLQGQSQRVRPSPFHTWTPRRTCSGSKPKPRRHHLLLGTNPRARNFSIHTLRRVPLPPVPATSPGATSEELAATMAPPGRSPGCTATRRRAPQPNRLNFASIHPSFKEGICRFHPAMLRGSEPSRLDTGTDAPGRAQVQVSTRRAQIPANTIFEHFLP